MRNNIIKKNVSDVYPDEWDIIQSFIITALAKKECNLMVSIRDFQAQCSPRYVSLLAFTVNETRRQCRKNNFSGNDFAIFCRTYLATNILTILKECSSNLTIKVKSTDNGTFTVKNAKKFFKKHF
jgi:hypothetical protein